MTRLVCAVLIFVSCLHIQTGYCGVGVKTREQTKNAESAEEEPDIESMKVEGGSVTWPFSKAVYMPNEIQSPIDVITSFIKDIKVALPTEGITDLKICEPEIPDVATDIFNSGKTVYVYIDGHEHPKLPYLEGGPLKGKYMFDQMHFHWGMSDDWGSEHFIDGESFAVEIHLVHYKSEYTDFKTAATKADGLAVLTILAQADSTHNPLLTPLSDLLDQLKTPFEHRSLHWKQAMQWAVSDIKANTEYYTYPGSLTTPPFSQNVVFIILPKPIMLSHEQLRAFRELLDDKKNGHKIVDNKRKLQPLNHRPIFKGLIDESFKTC